MDEDTLLLIRPSDLATLRMISINLEASDVTLRRSTAGDPAGIVIQLPPQHFREHPQFPQDDLVDIAAGAPTSLLFLLPEDVDELVIGEGGLLGLCERLEVSADSVIAVPARATLAPLSAHWRMSTAPELLSGRGSLWRAKLDAPVRDGALRARLKLTEIADAEFPVWDVIPSVPELRQRRGGVMEASRFDFSPIGASVRMHGPVDFHNDEITPDLQVLLGSYQHDIDFGRDSRVQVVSQGHLSSGHPASLIRLRRRIFVGGSPDIGFAQEESVAFLETINTVVVSDPVLAVDQLSAAYGGPARDMPFRTLRLLTTYASGIDDPPLDAEGFGPFWVEAGGVPLKFALQGIDWAGDVTDFSLPLVFIPGEQGFSQAAFSAVFNRSDVTHMAETGSVSIALVAPETPAAAGVAPLTVDSIVLGVQHALPGAGGPPVLPVLSSMRVVVDAATHFTGVKSSVEAVWHDAYRSSGMDVAANKRGSYLRLPDPLPIRFGDPRQIGGLAKPDMQVAALSVLKGAMPAGFDGGVPNVDLIKQQFAGAKVLGMIPLTDIVDFGKLGPPELTEKITKEQAELSYAFAARIKGEGNNSVLQPVGESALTLTAKTVRRFTDGATTATIAGTLSNVAIKIAGIVTLRFRELNFNADPGSTPTIDPKGLALSFDGDLAFLQTLGDELEKLGLGGFVVKLGTDRITAGFKVTLPALAMGMFSLTNLAVSAQLTVPFNGDPVEFTFAVAERFKPFSVMVSLFTGGGFFALTVTSRQVDGVRVEAALEFGGSMQFDLVVASGGLSVMAGIYFRLDGAGVTLGGYLRASGQLTVLGIITISADFFMQISYQESTSKAIGEASLTLGIKVLFFSKSVTLRVERRFSALSGDPSFTDCYELEDWEAYCDAFG